MIREAIEKIVSKEDLRYDEAYAVMNEIMNGETTATQNAAFLAALSTKSTKAETIEEIAGCAAAMREHAIPVDTGMDVFEIVGTGGDHAHSFNISTTAALVAAAGGVKVAKHGNRAASSQCGTADCLEALGVNMIVTDDDWYDYLKLFATFFRLAGYTGMMVMVDELVNVYKIPNSITRQYNYEKMLTMYNDTLQGKAKYLGILMGATPQALEDKRRGIYSYEALRSRLSEGRFSKPGARDLLAPVIRLEPLTAEEMLVLCEKLAEMHAGLYGYSRHITTEDLVSFIKIEYGRIGADQNITPREVIRDFIELLDLLYQHADMDITSLLESDEFSYAKSEAVSDETDAGFVEFTI